MTNYNLKAKNRETGESVQFVKLARQDKEDLYLSEYHDDYNALEFHELYEVITEPQEGWRAEFDKKFGRISEINRGEFVISDVSGSKFEAHTDDTGKVTSIGGFDSIKDFISQVQTQAYKQGQADAYRESASVARGDINKINN